MRTHTEIATPAKENARAPRIAAVVGSPRAGEACGIALMGHLEWKRCSVRGRAATNGTGWRFNPRKC